MEELILELQKGETFGPAVFASRYDGIDLLGPSCRLLVMEGLPAGTSDYELFKASALYGDLAHAGPNGPGWLAALVQPRSTLACISPMQFEQDWLANQPRQANS